MVKVVAMYGHPEDKQAFDAHYFEKHIPLTEKIPGLKEVKVSKYDRDPMGNPSRYYIICEMYYDNMDELKNGLSSDEGRASAKDAMSLAGKSVTFMVGEDADG